MSVPKPTVDTQIIKKGLAWRAKYRLNNTEGPNYRHFSPGLAVPHPQNRAGDPVRSMRTKQLCDIIAKEGFDEYEAKSSPVAVMSPPREQKVGPGKVDLGTLFQANFERQVEMDQGMAKNCEGVVAVLGTLSHSHLNCVFRNIRAGMPGCQCTGCPEYEQCTCPSKPFLSVHGLYCQEKLRQFCPTFAEFVDRGLPWELLSHQMDVEEPGAALEIAIALNKKNAAAMATAHTEIMRTLVGLCKPDPHSTVVEFDPLRSRMVDLYGADVDNGDFHHAFRLVMDAGGSESPHMADLLDFTQQNVNPKVRKLPFSAYSVVSGLPYSFPKLKNALVKWAWKQPVCRGWCPLPPQIGFRLEEGGRANMLRACEAMEEAMLAAMTLGNRKEVQKVIKEKEQSKEAQKSMISGNQKLSKPAKIVAFIGEIDIGFVNKLLSEPKQDEKHTVVEQSERLMKTCAEYMALKVDQLLGKDNHAWATDTFKKYRSVIVQEAVKMLGDETLLSKIKAEAAQARGDGNGLPGKTRGHGGDVVLPPTIAALDSSGRVMCPPPVHAPASTVDVNIPWTMWLPAAVPDCLRSNVKSMVRAAVWQAARHYHASLMQLPIVFVKKGTALSCKATQAIPKGKLVVPVFVRRDTSLVYMDAAAYASVSKQAVMTRIAWAPSAQDAEASGGSEEDLHTIAVMPELKLPKPAVAGETTAWELHDNVHPFWAIPRQRSED